METEGYSVTFLDQVGSETSLFQAVIPTLQLTVRDLIDLRIREEIIRINQFYEQKDLRPEKTTGELKRGATFQFAWMDLPREEMTSWESQAAKAHQAFEKGQFFICVDRHQVQGLDTEILLAPEAIVQFIKLIPLIGG